MRSRYKDLVAYQRSVEVSDEIHACIRRWPELDRASIGPQLLRAIDSVGANIAEAAGRWTKAERRRFLLTARGSLYETEHWIDRATARHLPLPRDLDRLDEVVKALNGLLRRHS